MANKSFFSTSVSGQYQLRIARQPPGRTVYQRILKPFPAVMLVGGTAHMEAPNTNLFVEATLLRSDSDVELPLCIEGNRIVRISNGVFATFKKLKILSTSQQQGTLFRLKFVLKRYVGNVFEQIPHAHVISNPIEVFSHTLYLTEKQEGTGRVVVISLTQNQLPLLLQLSTKFFHQMEEAEHVLLFLEVIL